MTYLDLVNDYDEKVSCIMGSKGGRLTDVGSMASRLARTGAAAATSGCSAASASQAFASAPWASEEVSFPDRGARRSAYMPAALSPAAKMIVRHPWRRHSLTRPCCLAYENES